MTTGLMWQWVIFISKLRYQKISGLHCPHKIIRVNICHHICNTTSASRSLDDRHKLKPPEISGWNTGAWSGESNWKRPLLSSSLHLHRAVLSLYSNEHWLNQSLWSLKNTNNTFCCRGCMTAHALCIFWCVTEFLVTSFPCYHCYNNKYSLIFPCHHCYYNKYSLIFVLLYYILLIKLLSPQWFSGLNKKGD